MEKKIRVGGNATNKESLWARVWESSQFWLDAAKGEAAGIDSGRMVHNRRAIAHSWVQVRLAVRWRTEYRVGLHLPTGGGFRQFG